jgi:hypothetical protein
MAEKRRTRTQRRSSTSAATSSSRQPRPWWKRPPTWIGASLLLPIVAAVAAEVLAIPIKDMLFGKESPPSITTPRSNTATATTPTSNPAPTTKPPLIVTPAAFKPAFGLPSRGVVVPRPPNKIPRPPPYASVMALSNWAGPLGGVPAKELTTTLVLERAETSGVVIVTDVRPVVKRRLPAIPPGTWVTPFGGGGQPYRFVFYDLEANPPRVTGRGADPASNPNWRFPLRVSSTDPEVVLVIGRTRNHLIEWELEVEYIYQGIQYKTTIKDHGKPFRTTGVTGFTQPILPPANATGPWP